MFSAVLALIPRTIHWCEYVLLKQMMKMISVVQMYILTLLGYSLHFKSMYTLRGQAMFSDRLSSQSSYNKQLQFSEDMNIIPLPFFSSPLIIYTLVSLHNSINIYKHIWECQILAGKATLTMYYGTAVILRLALPLTQILFTVDII